VRAKIEVVRTVVEGDQTMLLRRRRALGTPSASREALELVLGNVVLLSSAALETERAFGRLAARAPAGNILVGGLGFGATLAGVLEVVPDDAQVIVAEKLAAVVSVARAEAAALVGPVLDDRRVTLRLGDVGDVIAGAEPGSFGAILLDVDNGPEWASFRSNAKLYAEAALGQAARALAPGGLYAVWSGYPADAFVGRLRRAGFAPATELLREGAVVRARAYLGVRETT
jgi:hypothetical protein